MKIKLKLSVSITQLNRALYKVQNELYINQKKHQKENQKNLNLSLNQKVVQRVNQMLIKTN